MPIVRLHLGGTGSPLLPVDAIQAMRALRVAFGNAWMIEVGMCIVHADPFHDGAGSLIENCCEGDDLFQTNLFKADAKRAPRRLGCEPSTPISARQAPAYFDARRKRENAPRNRETDKTNEQLGLFFFNSPVAPTPFCKLQLPCVDARVTGFACDERWEELHDGRIGVQRGKWFTVPLTPLPQVETGCFELNDCNHDA